MKTQADISQFPTPVMDQLTKTEIRFVHELKIGDLVYTVRKPPKENPLPGINYHRVTMVSNIRSIEAGRPHELIQVYDTRMPDYFTGEESQLLLSARWSEWLDNGKFGGNVRVNDHVKVYRLDKVHGVFAGYSTKEFR